MAEKDKKIKIKDIFNLDESEEFKRLVKVLQGRFDIHNHDGRNSVEIDFLGSQKAIRLLALAPLSDKSDDNVIISGATSLTRDMFYDKLTIEDGGILSPSSFRINADIVEINTGGIIRNNGNNAGNGGNGGDGTVPIGGTAGAAGTGGAVVTAGSLPAGEDGKAGGIGGIGNDSGGGSGSIPDAGVAGDSVSKSLGAAGTGGGGGGTSGNNSAGSGGNGGSQTGTVLNIPKSVTSAYTLMDPDFSNNKMVPLLGSAGSGGGGGGAGGDGDGSASQDGGGGGGGGGGSGSTGGTIAIFARQIINNGIIEAKGGTGGSGGDGGNTADGADPQGATGGGGGGGGAGGSGGLSLLVYGDLSGPGTIDVSGGSAGAAGSGGTGDGSGNDGNNGSAGTAGATGTDTRIQISSIT